MKGKSHRKGFYISFGHNTRSKLGFTHGERAALTLKGAVGKRLTLHLPESIRVPAQAAQEAPVSNLSQSLEGEVLGFSCFLLDGVFNIR